MWWLRTPVLMLVLVAASAKAEQFRWPDPGIEVPPDVRAFIRAECAEAEVGLVSERLDECISGEMYGYRAVVTMLSDAQIGAKAADRYRACRAGLGPMFGRFHRDRATCMQGVLSIKWRFEFTQRADVDGVGRSIADEGKPMGTRSVADPSARRPNASRSAFAGNLIDPY